MDVVIDGVIYQWQLYGGISRMFNEILPRMCRVDASLQIVLLWEGEIVQSPPDNPRIKHTNIPAIHRYLRPGRLWKPIMPWAKDLVRRMYIGRGKGKIWHSTYYSSPNSWDGLVVVTVADMIHEKYKGLFDHVEDELFRQKKERCIREADKVICISESTRQDLHDHLILDSEDTVVIPLACSEVFRMFDRDEPALRAHSERPFLLYVGDRNHYKNFHTLIEAYSRWSKRKDISLTVVGRPWSMYEQQRIRELNLLDHVQLITSIDDQKLCFLYNLAEAFVYPSLYEGFGIPLLEAMSCACPIVASRIPSSVEVAGDCPIYFEPNDTESLVASLDFALSHSRQSDRVKSGLFRAKGYSWDKTALKTLEVYRSLLGRGFP